MEIKIIEISVPADHIVEGKEKEKIDKYQELRIEIERQWKKKTCTVPVSRPGWKFCNW
jgi:hypothetical protein